METLKTSKHRMLIAGALIALLALLAPHSHGAAGLARWTLAALCLGGGLLWFRRGTTPRPGREETPAALEVTSKVALSPRCGVALVAAGGHSYLVVHGDGFAEICPTLTSERASVDLLLAQGRGVQ